MAALMAKLRADAPKTVGGLDVVAIRDYKEGTITAADGTVSPTGLPKSNVLCFDLAGGNTVVVRPSGTGPKIKFYLELKDTMGCANCYPACVDKARARVEEVKKSLGV
jgi:phosphoglucomutase